MFKTAARILLLRVLPRRLIPIITVVEALLFFRSIRKRSKRAGDDVVRVNDPSVSRTAPPAPPAPRASRIGRPTLRRR